LAHIAGFKTGIITGKTSKPLEIRAQKLKITELHQGILDKMPVFEKILDKHALAPEEVAFIGDDLGDLEVLKSVGLAGAVADAHPFVKKDCHFISEYPGGGGAVREFIELILEAQDKWPLIQKSVKSLTDGSDIK
jgi:3-deoxy-D-manno-octulosonate 8-phosphate phosphatase (KDO 8-P phosphatase)